MISVIGIGSGNAATLSSEAIAAIGRVDVFVAFDKGEGRADLGKERRALSKRYAKESSKWVNISDPKRESPTYDEKLRGEHESYEATIRTWTEKRSELLESVIKAESEDGCVLGILVWGDPSIYDATLRILEAIEGRRSLDLEIAVTPGISSIQLLAARHKISLTRVGRPLLVTTGRRLRQGWPDAIDDVVVMLDSSCAFRDVDPTAKIYWGAYLGSEDEKLLSGVIAEVGERIIKSRSQLREKHGWIMDTYLLRRGD